MRKSLTPVLPCLAVAVALFWRLLAAVMGHMAAGFTLLSTVYRMFM